MQSFGMNLRYLLATILFSLILGASTFSFKDAKNWGIQYPNCNGKYQSPIAMNETFIHWDFPAIEEKLKFTDLGKLPRNITMKNTGHTVEIKADWSGEPPKVSGAPLHEDYVFEKISFLWAQKKWTEYVNYHPSLEDVLSSDMEMHFYFYKAGSKSFEKAQSEQDGLAVFKVVLLENDTQNEDLLVRLTKIIPKVQSIGSTAAIPPFPLVNCLGSAPLFFFHKGSLVYPPCTESVTWFDFGSGIFISKNLLKAFREIKLDNGDVSNVRPLQPLNKRLVQAVYTK